MRPTGLLPKPVTVENTATTTDGNGDASTAVTATRTFNGWKWLASADERTDAGDLQTQEWKVGIDADAAGFINGRSRVVIDGVRYEVIGFPWPVDNPRTGEISHVEATIRRSDG